VARDDGPEGFTIHQVGQPLIVGWPALECNRDVTSTEPGMPQVQLLTCSQPAL